MVMRASFWADSMRGTPVASKFRENLCPANLDVIPAFSLLEVDMACRGWSRWESGERERFLCISLRIGDMSLTH